MPLQWAALPNNCCQIYNRWKFRARKELYPAERRFTKEYLTDLFKQYYAGKRIIGISCDLGQTNLDYYKKLYNFEYLSK